MEDDNDSITSSEDIEDTLILNVNSLIESLILNSGAFFHSSSNKKLFQFSNLKISRRYILLTTKT